MKNKDVKKIQLGGWNTRRYSNVRAKINRISDSEDEVGTFKSRKKKGNKKYCTKTKGSHSFVTVIKTLHYYNGERKWPSVECEHCGFVDFFRSWHESKKEKENEIIV